MGFTRPYPVINTPDPLPGSRVLMTPICTSREAPCDPPLHPRACLDGSGVVLCSPKMSQLNCQVLGEDTVPILKLLSPADMALVSGEDADLHSSMSTCQTRINLFVSLFTLKIFFISTLQKRCVYKVYLCYHCDCGGLLRDRVGGTARDRNEGLASQNHRSSQNRTNQMFSRQVSTFGGTPKHFHHRDQAPNSELRTLFYPTRGPCMGGDRERDKSTRTLGAQLMSQSGTR